MLGIHGYEGVWIFFKLRSCLKSLSNQVRWNCELAFSVNEPCIKRFDTPSFKNSTGNHILWLSFVEYRLVLEYLSHTLIGVEANFKLSVESFENDGIKKLFVRISISTHINFIFMLLFLGDIVVNGNYFLHIVEFRVNLAEWHFIRSSFLSDEKHVERFSIDSWSFNK